MAKGSIGLKLLAAALSIAAGREAVAQMLPVIQNALAA